jgi:hypothetical protein
MVRCLFHTEHKHTVTTAQGTAAASTGEQATRRSFQFCTLSTKCKLNRLGTAQHNVSHTSTQIVFLLKHHAMRQLDTVETLRVSYLRAGGDGSDLSYNTNYSACRFWWFVWSKDWGSISNWTHGCFFPNHQSVVFLQFDATKPELPTASLNKSNMKIKANQV